MDKPETDDAYRARIMPLATEDDSAAVKTAVERDLDTLGRKYGRFRTGAPLPGEGPAPVKAGLLRFWPEWPGADGASEGEGDVPPPIRLNEDDPHYRLPPHTVVSAAYPHDRVERGPVRAFLCVGRLGGVHTLQYIFLPDDPSLEGVEALVRTRPDYFPGDTVVIDLGESYASIQEAAWFVAAMRDERPVAVIMIGDDPVG